MRDPDALGDSSFIYGGSLQAGFKLRVRWMRYREQFPARLFLEKYPEDLGRFFQRAKEMAIHGRIRLHVHGHWLKEPYSELHQFNMDETRSWGFLDGRVYIVLSAAKKRTTGQERDYDRALAIRDDYLKGPRHD